MNFDEAIAAHTQWKVRLRTFIDGTGEKLESTTVRLDNPCDVGKWIHGGGRGSARCPRASSRARRTPSSIAVPPRSSLEPRPARSARPRA